MNFKVIAHYLSLVMRLEAVFMLIPLAVSLIYRDFLSVRGFVVTMGALIVLSVPLGLPRFEKKKLYAKESFLIVAISWVCISVFGALPFYFSGEVPRFIDCLFESISGFSTTGASALADVEALSRGILFWRSFTHWIGGMGVLVFLMAIVPAVAGDRTLQVMKAEAPGPAPGKLVPKMRQTSLILYIIYFVLTVMEVVVLAACGMPWFDSVLNAMATAGTGGFAPLGASIAAYGSPSCEIVITIFMILFGINFNLYFLMISGNIKSVPKSEELRVYLAVITISIALIAWNTVGFYPWIGDTLRHASFQVASVVTTTGFVTTDFSVWPSLSKTIMFILMFVGGCSGSTAGGMKVSRWIILFRECKRALFQIIRPRSVEIVKLDGKAVDKGIVQGVCNYAILCIFIFFVTLLVVSLENLDAETTISAVATCLNNVGLAFGKLGPGGSFADFSVLSKLILSLNMLLGRLELYPIMLLLSPRTYQRV